MSGLTPAEVHHHVKIYIRVFFALAVLTVLTVGVSYLHLPVALAVAVALVIATFKASLVATFFMHLNAERKIVMWILALTMFFFIFLLIWPTISSF